jgi:hypothetical protein
MQLFGDLDIFSFVRVSQQKWIVHVNRMDSERAVSQVFNNNNTQESQLKGQPKNTQRNCVQAELRHKIKNGKGSSKKQR